MTWPRRLAVVAVAGAAPLALPGVAAAHGIGGRSDLPVPTEYFLVGAGLALVVSFVLLAVLWPEPRLQDGPRPRVLGIPARPIGWVLAALGLLGLAAVVVTGLFGEEDRNTAAPGLVWVWFWLVIPFLGGALGNLWRAINPWSTVARLTGLGKDERPELIDRVGMWPATALFVAFTWFELVYDDQARPAVVAVAALVYSVYLLQYMSFAGRRTALATGAPFTAYNDLISSIAPLDGRGEKLVWRGWLRALPAFPYRPGLTVFVVAMIATVSYDGLSATPWWRDTVGSVADDMWFGTVALLGAVAVIGAGYYAASWAAVRLAGDTALDARAVANSFAHTLVPIALAYAVAHYFSLVIFEGQTLLFALSDPLGRGWDWFGTADNRIDFTLLSPEGIWYVQVAAIVAGHVAAVVLAHDRALAVFKKEGAVRSQYAMLALMVGLTVLGLTLLSVS